MSTLPNNKNSSRTATTLLVAILGILIGTNIYTLYARKGEFLACTKYTFVNPRFACEDKTVIKKTGYSELKFTIMELIEKREEEGKASSVAVWFRDLEAGPTFGINDRQDFIPASLLKLPLAITYFRLAEDDPAILQEKIKYEEIGAVVPSQIFSPKDPLRKGQVYTIDELITHTITNSDNIAAQLLFEYILKKYPSHNLLSEMYRDLGILDPGFEFNRATVNTQGYGSIFRLLYNASFLTNEYSEKLLFLLTQSEFKYGLHRGVPEGIPISHKFGERFLESGEKQLHDCGIVYYPDNPYQLCIMTRGDDYGELQGVIGEISKAVFEEFDSRRIVGGSND